MRLFHVSEEAGIGRFKPRPPPSTDAGVTGDCVWAVDERHLANFLTPRDCPRITFAAGPRTTPADRDRFLGAASRVVAIEWDWLERLSAARLSVYDMPADPFELVDPGAGYWISRVAVVPTQERRVDDLLGALRQANVELRLLTAFWPLSDAVAASSLEFSIIRKRNARPDGAGV